MQKEQQNVLKTPGARGKKCTKQLQEQVTGSLSKAVRALGRESSTTITRKTIERWGYALGLAQIDTCRSIWHWGEATTSLLKGVDWWLAPARSGAPASFLPRWAKWEWQKESGCRERGNKYKAPDAQESLKRDKQSFGFSYSKFRRDSGHTSDRKVIFWNRCILHFDPSCLWVSEGFTYHTNACLRSVGMGRTHFSPLESFYCEQLPIAPPCRPIYQSIWIKEDLKCARIFHYWSVGCVHTSRSLMHVVMLELFSVTEEQGELKGLGWNISDSDSHN